MENEQFDTTRPIRPLQPDTPEPAAEESAASLAETRQVRLSADTDDLAHTQATGVNRPMAVAPEEQSPAETGLSELEAAAGLDATIPPPAGLPAGPPLTPPPAGPRPGRALPLRWILLGGILFLLLTAALSSWGGYQSGIAQRKQAELAQVSGRVEEQFVLALQDIEAKRYYLARQRLEYVIELDPAYPGVTEKLAEVLLQQNTTATPTLAPTPTLTPTPDLRGVEDLFSQSQMHITNQEWPQAIDTLLALRKAAPTYQPVWVDDMLYVSFRNRGVNKILRDGDLEGGIFDLTQAERLGPLDADASGYLTWARLYITGASFWELDWGQAVYYFAQVAPALPNLRDGSNMTATERYRQALIGYGEHLAENDEWCSAYEQFELALSFAPDAEAASARDEAADKCGVGEEDSDSEESEAREETIEPTEPPVEETPTTEPAPTDPPATEEPPPAEETPYPSP